MHPLAAYTSLSAALASSSSAALASSSSAVAGRSSTHTAVSHTAVTTKAVAGTGTGTGNVVTTTAPVQTPVTQLTIYNVYEIDINVTPLISIVTANPTATCFEIACPVSVLDTNSKACGNLQTPLTVTEGASVIAYASSGIHTATGSASTATATTTENYQISCSFEGTTAAACTQYTLQSDTRLPPVGSSTYKLEGSAMYTHIPAQITAGSYKLLNNTNGLTGSGTVGTVGTVGSAGSIGTLTKTVGRTPPKPTTQPSHPSSSPAPTSSSSSQMAAGIAIPAVGSLAGLLLAVAAAL